VNDTIAASAVPFNVRITANIAGGGTAGTVKMQFAENTAGDSTSITVKQGSTMNAYRVTGADLAEFYKTWDETLTPADVVSLDSLMVTGVKKSDRAYDPKIVGVISTKPGLVLGDSLGGSGYPALVALSGRVPVKVTTENGPIRPGDILTASSTPGVAMKLTKTGAGIGMAMTGYNAPGIGMVTVFVKTGYSSAAKVVNLMAESGSEQVKSLLSEGETGRAALQYVLENGSNLKEDAGLSEILTDRVVAGLEMVTPKLTAEQIFASKILPIPGENLVFESDGGQFVFKRQDASSSAVVIDASGSAMFAGGVTADWIKANHIEGLEVLSRKFSGLETKIASLSGETAATPTPGLLVSTTNPDQDETIFRKIRFDSGEAVIKFTVFGDLEADSGLVVNGPATFANEVVFKTGPTFESGPLFGKDSVGMAVVSRGTDRVDIVFGKEYLAYPMVSASMAFNVLKTPDGAVDEEANSQLEKRILAENYTFMVTRKTPKGFTIVLNKTAGEDITFSWAVLAAKEPKTFTSALILPTPTLIIEASPEVATPTPEEAATVSAGLN
jgi:hypothetical protein